MEKIKSYYKKNKGKSLLIGLFIVIVSLILINNLVKPAYPDVYVPRPVEGNADAKVTLTEFSDYECPACKVAYFDVQRLLDEYSDDIKIEYKHLPLRSIHPYAQKAAEAAECANDQGKFWEYTDLLFKNSPELSKTHLKVYAEETGLNKSFEACLESGSKEKVVETDFREALRLGIQGTPTFFVNGEQMTYVNGMTRYDILKKMIEDELSSS
ncbi:hypothetical protein C0585_06650 [Candidatus Woesearchaeota archaeon]|nr:MAG: hypothetical protein C0585_06650 [Candidatus Woesearchaeota archaeon]